MPWSAPGAYLVVPPAAKVRIQIMSCQSQMTINEIIQPGVNISTYSQESPFKALYPILGWENGQGWTVDECTLKREKQAI